MERPDMLLLIIDGSDAGIRWHDAGISAALRIRELDLSA
jgi:hypothetical protein